jgi:hypothetical protein
MMTKHRYRIGLAHIYWIPNVSQFTEANRFALHETYNISIINNCCLLLLLLRFQFLYPLFSSLQSFPIFANQL